MSVTVKGEEVKISTLGAYLDVIDRAGVSVNVASYVGLGNIWKCVMGDSFDPPSGNQIEQMKEHPKRAIKNF